MLKIGFTGTQDGLTGFQIQKLLCIVGQLNDISLIKEAHHGDCIGGDYVFHKLCNSCGVKLILHPPVESCKRAFCNKEFKSEVECAVLEEKKYIDRNHDIVDNTNFLIACPRKDTEEVRSGTWATICYARKQNKHIIIIYPENVEVEECK